MPLTSGHLIYQIFVVLSASDYCYVVAFMSHQFSSKVPFHLNPAGIIVATSSQLEGYSQHLAVSICEWQFSLIIMRLVILSQVFRFHLRLIEVVWSGSRSRLIVF